MRRLLALVAAIAVALLVASSALAAGGNNRDGTKDVGSDYNHGKARPIDVQASDRLTGQAPLGPARVGDQRIWMALDDISGPYLKFYTLKGVGNNIEVWVANNLNFPAGDCRNDGVRNVVTSEQIQRFITEFDTNIYPTESEVFSTPPPRNGSGGKDFAKFLRASFPTLGNFPSSYYVGDAKNIVVFIDNVRDDNYYDLNNTQQHSYIAGFFWSYFNESFDRNIMTIDSYDWVHRTGDDPPHEPFSGENEGCLSKPAKPNTYEGVFAHEYQHLLEYYASPGEVSWVNEGLSDYAARITGYSNPATPITEVGYDSHVQCFLGWGQVQTDANPNPKDTGGAENSLTLWGDQGGDEILCDYGAAFTFMEFLESRFGRAFMTALHNQDANGLPGLQAVLDRFVTGKTARQVVHEWAAAMALDKYVAASSPYGAATLDASINWDVDDAYESAGAPPNGSDYVRLRDGGGDYLGASSITSIAFDGGETLVPRPLEWTEDDGVLYSGTGDLLDRSMARSVAVDAASATLTFKHRYNLEVDWDFGFVQISADGGDTWSSVACSGTTTQHNSDAHPTVKANLPGFSGVKDWTTVTCDLSAYAGKTVLLAFRNVTDWSTTGNGEDVGFAPGWWVDDVTVSGNLVSDGSLAGWGSPTMLNPIANTGTFTVQLVSYASDGSVAKVAQLPLGAGHQGSLSGAALAAAIAQGADVVAALVMLDDETEQIVDYAPYTLTVNGVVQPGGGS